MYQTHIDKDIYYHIRFKEKKVNYIDDVTE